MRPAAPVRLRNPFFTRKVIRSGVNKEALAVVGGYTHYIHFYDNVLRAGHPVIASPLTVGRLERVADTVGFPRDEIFLDAGGGR